MKRVGIFIDAGNIYYCVKKKFGDRKLNYQKYLDFVKDFGEVARALVYGSQMWDEAENFIDALEAIGYKTEFKRILKYKDEELTSKRTIDWNVQITIDIFNILDRLDMIILGSSDRSLEPLIEWATQRGLDIIILACGVPRELRHCATKVIEIPESLLE